MATKDVVQLYITYLNGISESYFVEKEIKEQVMYAIKHDIYRILSFDVCSCDGKLLHGININTEYIVVSY